MRDPRGLSFGSCSRLAEYKSGSTLTYLDDFQSEIDQIINGILL